jgi:S-adenosylmethionine uptake transporter
LTAPLASAAEAARTANLRGALLMAVSTAGYALNDSAIKTIGDAVPLAQLLFLRGVVTCVLMLLAVRWIGAIRWDLPRREWGLILLRSLADLGATFFFVTALLNMPLANVTAILQALPLTVALAAALFLGEPLGWRRLSAILIGFVGVMLIIRPGAEGFDAWSLWGLGAVGFITLRDLLARQLAPTTPSATVAFAASAVVVAAFGLTMLFEPWTPLTPRSAGLVGLAGIFILSAYVASVATMRAGDIGFVAPFRYTGLVWALVLGLVIFGDWPDGLTLVGAAIVVATGLFTLYRERMLARAKSRTAQGPKG